jgi:hypothetical protein
MTYLVSPRFINHRVFLGSLVLSHPLGSSDLISEDEYEPLSIYGIPLQIWISKACVYTFKRDDQADGFSLQQDFLPPTHIHEFYFVIDYISIYARFVLELPLLFHMIKHRGICFDGMID